MTEMTEPINEPLKAQPSADDRTAPQPLFTLEDIRLSQDFVSLGPTKKVLSSVPARKPGRHTFFRVHPHPAYRLETQMLFLREDREELYLLAPQLHSILAEELKPALLVTAITRQKNVFVWPIKLPGDEGRRNEWTASALKAAETAKTSWVRMSANMELGAYDVVVAQGELAEPEWPSESFHDLVLLAFKDRYISTRDHPTVKRLLGEA